MKRKLFAVGFILFIFLCCLVFLRYIFIYNKGNKLYERMDYAGAIEQYQNALDAHPPHFKECSIRINLALAMIYNMGPEFAAPENVESSIQTLMEARDILLEDDCATNEGDGHSEPAQQLKEEIDALIEQLQQQQNSDNSDDSDDNSDGGGSSSEPSVDPEVEQAIQEELQEIQNTAQGEREEYIQQQNDFSSEINFDYDMKIW